MPSDKWFIIEREKDYAKPYAKEAINIDDVASFYAKKRTRITKNFNTPDTINKGYELYIFYKPDMKNPLLLDMTESHKVMEWLRDVHDIDLFAEEKPDGSKDS